MGNLALTFDSSMPVSVRRRALTSIKCFRGSRVSTNGYYSVRRVDASGVDLFQFEIAAAWEDDGRFLVGTENGIYRSAEEDLYFYGHFDRVVAGKIFAASPPYSEHLTSGIARLGPDGTLDRTFRVDLDGEINR